MILAEGIPSPPVGVWHLGPLPIRAYAIAILIGGILAYLILKRRYTARGGPAEPIADVTIWAVAFGILGARIYHVITSPAAYFGPNGNPVRALYIWEGGLGIWGAIALGAVGAWIGLRRAGLRMAPFADALAPGLLVAQAVGRLGNYFNQELFGAPTTLPWGLRIDDAHLVGTGFEPGTLFHPTFLYELLWNLAAAALLVWLDRRFRLGNGRVFWLYVVLYTAGRGWIEALRVDDAQHILGLRLNVWTSIVVGLVALALFLLTPRREPDPIWLPGRAPAAGDGVADGAADDGAANDGIMATEADGAAADGAPPHPTADSADSTDSSPAPRRAEEGQEPPRGIP